MPADPSAELARVYADAEAAHMGTLAHEGLGVAPGGNRESFNLTALDPFAASTD